MVESLFIKNEAGDTAELAVYEKTDLFPYPTRYISLLTASGRRGYVALDDLGAEYDSGLRYTESATGKVYQVCARVATNVVKTYIHVNNYFARLTAVDAEASLKAIFEDRVTVDGDYVKLRAPSPRCGVQKMLIIGDGVEVTCDELTYSLGANGAGNQLTSVRAILVKFDRSKVYRFKFSGNAFMVVGQNVDGLQDSAGSTVAIANWQNTCSLAVDGSISTTDPQVLSTIADAQAMLTADRVCNYFVLTNEVCLNLKQT